MADIVVDGMTRVAFVPAIASTAAPSAGTELSAGTLLHDTLIPAGLEGFEASTDGVDASSLASTFSLALPGRQSVSGLGLVLKKQDGTDTIFNLLSVPNTNGFIVIRDSIAAATNWAASQKVEVWPIRTAAHIMLGRGEANSLLRYRIPLFPSGAPNLKATVAA